MLLFSSDGSRLRVPAGQASDEECQLCSARYAFFGNTWFCHPCQVSRWRKHHDIEFSPQKSEKLSRPQAFARSLWDRHGLQDEFIAKIKMPYLKPHAWRRSRSHQRALASGAEATVLLGTAAASAAAAAARARAGLCNGEARSRASMRAMDPSPLILRLDEASKNHWRRDRRPVIPMLLNARCGPTPFWHRRVCPLFLVFSQTLPSFREIPKHGETPILVTKPPGTRMQQAP